MLTNPYLMFLFAAIGAGFLLVIILTLKDFKKKKTKEAGIVIMTMACALSIIAALLILLGWINS